jgi:hypothetical protein
MATSWLLNLFPRYSISLYGYSTGKIASFASFVKGDEKNVFYDDELNLAFVDEKLA